MKTEFSVLADVEADDLFQDENVNWKYCMEHATFVHKGACEFILHIGGEAESSDDVSYAENTMAEMRKFGCTPEFIAAYRDARDAGAMRVLFHAG